MLEYRLVYIFRMRHSIGPTFYVTTRTQTLNHLTIFGIYSFLVLGVYWPYAFSFEFSSLVRKVIIFGAKDRRVSQFH